MEGYCAKTTDVAYLTCAETAKLVRPALRDRFPGVKFSVRSDTYSGGASIDVRWGGGPSQAAVDETCRPFRGADFDGSIDLMHYRRHWLLPNGRVVLESDEGTVGSRGTHPRRKGPGAEFGEVTGARLVHFGADFIFTRRE